MTDPVLLLRRLVEIDSVNPTLVPGAAGERRIAAFLAETLRAAGLTVSVWDAAPGRPNVVGVVEGRLPGRTLLFCGHTDTVGVAGMTSPFTPAEIDGRLYGRGAQDMKGGVAAMCAAAMTLARDGLERGRVVVACVADEEWASAGADALVKDWTADAAVVTEPTDLRVAIAHKGFLALEVETFGVAAHGSMPAEGRDAIFRMARVVAALEQLDRDLQGGPTAPLVGSASLHASTIHGGREWSTYPDRCVLELERRTIPGEVGSVGLREVESILAAIQERDPEFRAEARLVFGRPPYAIDERAELPQVLAAVCAEHGRPGPFVGMPFWTDAAILGTSGIPSVLFGPGGAGLHSREEYVRLEEVVACRAILVDLARRFT